jgi:hypothetical protein
VTFKGFFLFSRKKMQIYITIALVLLAFAILYKGGFVGSSAAVLPIGFPRGGANGADVLDDNKEKFSLENNPVNGGTTSTAQIERGAALTTVKPSELLPSDPNVGFTSLSGGAPLIEAMVPAEISDPSRQPVYTSTSKSKIPNWQLRADPLVDRSVVAGQFFNLTPDTHPDMYKNRGVEITRKMVTE